MVAPKKLRPSAGASARPYSPPRRGIALSAAQRRRSAGVHDGATPSRRRSSRVAGDRPRVLASSRSRNRRPRLDAAAARRTEARWPAPRCADGGQGCLPPPFPVTSAGRSSFPSLPTVRCAQPMPAEFTNSRLIGRRQASGVPSGRESSRTERRRRPCSIRRGLRGRDRLRL